MNTTKKSQRHRRPGHRPPAAFAFVDVETTGLDPKRHEIIEIAVKKVAPDTFEELDKFVVKVRPERIAEADPRALELNGYRQTDWSEAVSLRSALDKSSQLLHGSILAGHNVSFDKAFLEEGFRTTGLPYPKLDYHTLDTASLAFPLWVQGYLENVTLKGVCTHLGVQHIDAHRAEGDVDATIEVASILMSFSGWGHRLWRLNPFAERMCKGYIQSCENCVCMGDCS